MPKILSDYGTTYAVILLVIFLCTFTMVKSEEPNSNNLEMQTSSSNNHKKLLPLFHPFLKNIKLSESMKSLLKDIREKRNKRALEKRMLVQEYPNEVYIIKDNKLVPLKPMLHNPTRYASQSSKVVKAAPKRSDEKCSTILNSGLVKHTSAAFTIPTTSTATTKLTTTSGTSTLSTTPSTTSTLSAAASDSSKSTSSVSSSSILTVTTDRPQQIIIFNNVIPPQFSM